jgi:hypothetical protein
MPAAGTKFIDTDVAPGGYSYLVTTITSTGCQSSPSNGLSVQVGP